MINKKWLVISNCQAAGLGDSFSLLCPRIDIDRCDYVLFRNQAETMLNKLLEYDRLIVGGQTKNRLVDIVGFSEFANVTILPEFIFSGFHPDLTYVSSKDELVKGPLGDYHSTIVLAGYKSGLSPTQTRGLFLSEYYAEFCFFEWDNEKKFLFDTFEAYGIDIRRDFIRWARAGVFMYSSNHPKIDILYDLAHKIVEGFKDEDIVNTDIRPCDIFASGPVYPVYPDIARHYGLGTGSFYFKACNRYKFLKLDEFILESYNVYGRYDFDSLVARNSRYRRIIDFIDVFVND